MQSLGLFEAEKIEGARHYLPILTAVENQKGVLDVDTVKGCARLECDLNQMVDAIKNAMQTRLLLDMA